MKKSVLRTLLCSSTSIVLSAAPSSVLISSPASAATMCAATGTDITCTDVTAVVATGTTDGTVSDGPGLQVSSLGDQTTSLVGLGRITNDIDGDAAHLVSAAGNLTFNAAGIDFSTAGSADYAVYLRGQDVTATVGNLATTSFGGVGLYVIGNNLKLTAGNISTEAGASNGVSLYASGAADLTVGNINMQEHDSAGIFIEASGNINVAAGDITTWRPSSDAVYLDSESGTVTATIGNVGTAGADSRGVYIHAPDEINLTTGSVTTTGSASHGIAVDGSLGPITVNAGDIKTSGDDSKAIGVSGSDAITIKTGNLITTGDHSDAVTVFGGVGPVKITTGTIKTSGLQADGVNVTASGNITVNTGSITTSGDSARGVIINGQQGAISVTTGAVTTTGSFADGLDISGLGPITIVANGPITTGGSESDGISAGSDGPTDVTFGNISTTGLQAFGLSLVANGSIAVHQAAGTKITTTGGDAAGAWLLGNGVTGTLGDISSTGDGGAGVAVESIGDVDLKVGNVVSDWVGVGVVADQNDVKLTTGTVTTTADGAEGTRIDSTGDIIFSGGKHSTSGDNADALQINAVDPGEFLLPDVGSVVVTLAGATTTGSNSAGARITAGGPVTFTNTGTIAVSGDESIGIDIETEGDGPVVVNTGTVRQTGSDSPAAVRVISTGTGPVTVNATGNVSSASGAGIIAQSQDVASVIISSGAIVEGATNGVDLAGEVGNVLTVNGTVRSTTAGNAAYRVTGGPLTLNIGATGTMAGPLAFTAGDDQFNNAGNYTATGITDFLAGNDTVTNSGSIKIVGGMASFVNLETFKNAGGIIDMRNGLTSNVFNLSGNYVASGNARLGVDVGVANGKLSADKLVIAGTVTGTTTLLISAVPGHQVIDTQGVKIVDSAGGTGTFTGSATFGLIDYRVIMQGSDAFVVSAPNAGVMDIGQSFLLAGDLWHQSADALDTALEHGSVGKRKFSAFGQAYLGSDRRGERSSQELFGADVDGDGRIRTDRRGFQGGVEFAPEGTPVAFGITAGFERAEAEFVSHSDTDAKATGQNFGVYARFGGETGVYGRVLAKHDSFKLRMSNGDLFAVRPKGHANGLGGELGYRFGSSVLFDVSSGLSHVRTSVNDFEAGSISFDPGSLKNTRGTLSARATLDQSLAPFAEVKLSHEFEGDGRLALGSGGSSDNLESRGNGTWARFEAGIGGQGPGPVISAWGELGDVKGWGLRAGFRF